MKVMGIVAGPRKEGHTARLVEAVLSGAREAGHETEIFYMSDMRSPHSGKRRTDTTTPKTT